MSFTGSMGQSTPAWVQQAQAALIEASQQNHARARAKAAALVSIARRRRDPLGKFLRSKPAKRYVKDGRERINVSMPLLLAEMIHTEASDAKIAASRMVVLLCALGMPVWQEIRAKYITGTRDDIVLIPEMIKAILDNAVNPTPRKPKNDNAAWRAQVERALLASKPKRSRPKDETAAVLAGLGGGEGV